MSNEAFETELRSQYAWDVFFCYAVRNFDFNVLSLLILFAK